MAVTEGGRAGAHALSHRRAFSRAHVLRARARDGPHASDSRAHGAHPRAAARRPRLRRPTEASAGGRAPSCARRCKAFRRQALHASQLRARAPGHGRRARIREPARRRISRRCSRCCAPMPPERARERAFRALRPQWPAPPNVRAWVTERGSAGALRHAEPRAARRRRRELPSPPIAPDCARRCSSPAEPRWLEQVHGTRVLDLDREAERPPADGAVTARAGVVCAVLTADCLPVLLLRSRRAARRRRARGLARACSTASCRRPSRRCACAARRATRLARAGDRAGRLRGRRRGSRRVRRARPGARTAGSRRMRAAAGRPISTASRATRWRRRGVRSVHGGGFCTFTEAERFFSHRREAPCGRMATLIWLDAAP